MLLSCRECRRVHIKEKPLLTINITRLIIHKGGWDGIPFNSSETHEQRKRLSLFQSVFHIKSLCCPNLELIRCFLLHLAGFLEEWHDVTSVSVCVYLAHTHTDQTLPPLLPSITLLWTAWHCFQAKNYHISSPPKTPCILLSQPTNNGGEILLLEEERGISCLSSSQRGHKCCESFTNWCLRMVGRKKRGVCVCVLHCFLCIFVLFLALTSH